MNAQTMTPMQIQQKGLDILAKELGPVGFVRFLQQFELGRGDYTAERHEWLEDSDVATLANKIKAAQKNSSS